MSHQPTVMPSDVVKPTVVDTAPQQGSTMPNDGTEVHVKSHGPDAGNVNVVEIPGEKLTWKDQVIGHAKNARGTVTGNRELKEEGQAILQGQQSATETHHDTKA